MIIYSEYLFLENFIAGWIITFFSGKIYGRDIGKLRLLLCSALCGAFSFTMFLSVMPVVSFALKALFTIAAVTIAFGLQNLRHTIASAAVFFMITVLYGGTAMALLSVFGWQGIASGQGLYMPRVTYLTVSTASVAALLFLQLCISLIRIKRQAARTLTFVTVSMGDRQWRLTGFIDSGNLLREPLSGKPVALVGKTLMEEMLDGLTDVDARYAAIPFRAVGTNRGLLDAWRADSLEYTGGKIEQPILAVWGDGNFLSEEKEKQILLPSEMLERGIYTDVE